MFIGALNADVRLFLSNCPDAFAGATVVIGCSGNFTMETVLSQTAQPAAIHSNDVSLYSSLIGHYLTEQPFDCGIADPDYQWLEPYWQTPESRIAVVMVLLDMLEYEKRNTSHRIRMWKVFRDSFPTLVEATLAKIARAKIQVTSYFAGDVFAHFQRFGDDPKAVFCCFAPTYASGYEKLYKRLHAIIRWPEPTYPILDEEGRNNLLAWMRERRFLWYDDRIIEGLEPVMQQQGTLRQRTVYLYSNVIDRTAYLGIKRSISLPPYPLADGEFRITPESTAALVKMKTTDLAAFKDCFLSKHVLFGAGMWAFAIYVDDAVIGFLEYAPGQFGTKDAVYMQADFAIDGTIYRRLSRLVVMLAMAGETRRALERASQVRTRTLTTSAFTERPVSMKYRGILNLEKRGQTKDGQKFLNYGARFNDLTWTQTLQSWRTKHGSITSSSN